MYRCIVWENTLETALACKSRVTVAVYSCCTCMCVLPLRLAFAWWSVNSLDLQINNSAYPAPPAVACQWNTSMCVLTLAVLVFMRGAGFYTGLRRSLGGSVISAGYYSGQQRAHTPRGCADSRSIRHSVTKRPWAPYCGPPKDESIFSSQTYNPCRVKCHHVTVHF